ncbi:MAG: hypothetical protein IPM50_12405 [Acidobacteriota bacterium]|nr:MAG: hypothetical protein IPM50_12405 [Acidobacteriota bacterium]
MKLRTMILTAVATALLACGGGAGSSKITISFNGTSVPLDVKSSGVYPSTKTFSMTKDGETTMTKAVNHYVALSNFEMETKGPVTMGKALTEDGNVRVVFQIVGDEGTDEKAAVKPGTYTAKCEKYNCVDYLQISRFTGGKEEKISFTMSKAEGEVKITSVTDDTISGEINVSEGQHNVKGGFTAKITTKR